jgi:multidrug efflux pump subunit AcrA (membrane-fusion protein)
VITLPDLKEMTVMISIHEADIDKIKLGQSVLVTIEAYKNRQFPAKVTKIAAVASDDWSDSGNRSFTVTVLMEPIDIELRAGTSAKAEVQVEELVDVLQVPIHAVISEDGKHFCFVQKGESHERRDVTIGKNNNHHVEILTGLAEGERVLLYDPRLSGGANADRSTPAAEADEPAAMPIPAGPP